MISSDFKPRANWAFLLRHLSFADRDSFRILIGHMEARHEYTPEQRKEWEAIWRRSYKRLRLGWRPLFGGRVNG